MIRLLSLFGALFGGIFLGALGWLIFVPPPAQRLVLNSYVYPISSEDEEAEVSSAIALRSRQLENGEIELHADERSLELSGELLGLSVDRELAEKAAHLALLKNRVPFTQSPSLWLWRRFSSKQESVSIELPTKLKSELAEEVLRDFARLVDRDPVDAKLLISEHMIVESVVGRRLSVPATLVRLTAAQLSPGLVVDVVVDSVPPRITEDDLAPVDVTRVLASYETSFVGKAGARGVNIRTAGRYLNGAIVLPGELLSFNEQVGRRIHGRGFVDAPVIINDELELDVGGGVCQVATTLHAAAVYGNLEVVRRRSHSRPSGYAPLGLDATVIDGKVDLRIRNPFDEPLLVHVSFPQRYRIRVELLGRDPDAHVEHAYTVTHREPYARRIWHREEMPLGGFEKKQKGSEGMDVVSVLRIKHTDGREVRRSYRSKYYPVPEVFWMGKDAESSALPKLHLDAAALVIDGEEVEGATEASKRPEEEVPSLTEADSSDSLTDS